MQYKKAYDVCNTQQEALKLTRYDYTQIHYSMCKFKNYIIRNTVQIACFKNPTSVLKQLKMNV